MPFSSESNRRTLRSHNPSYYDILGVTAKSSQEQIRDAYRRKSKQYHPDTAAMDKAIAAQKFQAVSDAYDTLRSPVKRQQYDAQLKQQRSVELPRPKPNSHKKVTTSAFLDPEDRILSPGEVFALFILGITFLFCLLVALFLGVSRGEMLVQSIPADSSLIHQMESIKFFHSDEHPKRLSHASSTQIPQHQRPQTIQPHHQHNETRAHDRYRDRNTSPSIGRSLFPPTTPHS